MSEARRSPDRFETLIDLGLQLRADETGDAEGLRRRDREIGRAMGERDRRDRWRRATAWLRALDRAPSPRGGAVERVGHRVARARSALSLGGGALALFLGSGTAAAVFYYDGRQPVNVLWALAIFVALPTLLGAGSLLAMLPPALRARVPGLATLQDLLLWLNPARLVPLGVRFLPEKSRHAVAQAQGALRAEWTLYGGVQQWSVLSLAQGLAVLFQLGALATFLSLVFFTDLAFGWSTTLQIEPERFASFVRTLALPWGWLAPDALPSRELVAATQYYRLGDGVLPGGAPGTGDVAVLGHWWPFLACAMTAYGVLPRLVLWSVAGWRHRAALERALLRTPGYGAWVDRLTAELVETGAYDVEREGVLGAQTELAPAPHGGDCVVVDWAEVGLDEAGLRAALSARLELVPRAVMPAGGERSPQQDAEVIARVAAEDKAVCVVLVRAWEPPVLDLIDFLLDLREAWGSTHPILVSPVAFDAAGELAAPDPGDLAEWRRKLRSAGDPWLSLRALASEEAAK